MTFDKTQSNIYTFDLNAKRKTRGLMLSEKEPFQNKYKALVNHGSTWLIVRHTTNRPEGSEAFVNGLCSNLIEIEECLHGLIFNKFKALDIYPSDTVELDMLEGVKFKSYGELYDTVEEALQILSRKDFDGELK